MRKLKRFITYYEDDPSEAYLNYYEGKFPVYKNLRTGSVVYESWSITSLEVVAEHDEMNGFDIIKNSKKIDKFLMWYEMSK